MKHILYLLIICFVVSVQAEEYKFSCNDPTKREDGTDFKSSEIKAYRVVDALTREEIGSAAKLPVAVNVDGSRLLAMTVVDVFELESELSNQVIVSDSPPNPCANFSITVNINAL